jgi:hypothetical protein
MSDDPKDANEDANYYPPETTHNPEQVEVEQKRAEKLKAHLELTKEHLRS